MPGQGARTREEVTAALDHFERLANPCKVQSIKTATIDAFVARRRADRGKKEGSAVSPATVNKDLRHIRAALAVAHEWGYLTVLPKFRMEKVPRNLPTCVSGEHFAAIYQACGHAKHPEGLTFPAARAAGHGLHDGVAHLRAAGRAPRRPRP
jgi:hypothetical protein